MATSQIENRVGPRSFKIVTDSGPRLRRNRAHLRQSPEDNVKQNYEDLDEEMDTSRQRPNPTADPH